MIVFGHWGAAEAAFKHYIDILSAFTRIHLIFFKPGHLKRIKCGVQVVKGFLKLVQY